MYVHMLCVQEPEEVRKGLCFSAKVDLQLPDPLAFTSRECWDYRNVHSCYYEALGNKTRVSCMYGKGSTN